MTTATAVTLVSALGMVIAVLVFVRDLLRSHDANLAADRTVFLAGLNAIHETVSSTAGETARAVGQAVAASTMPPATTTDRDDIVHQVAHDLAERLAPADDVDDSDPTDNFVFRERGNAEGFDPSAREPFGVPGLSFEGPRT